MHCPCPGLPLTPQVPVTLSLSLLLCFCALSSMCWGLAAALSPAPLRLGALGSRAPFPAVFAHGMGKEIGHLAWTFIRDESLKMK